jgi:hypothetical protein
MEHNPKKNNKRSLNTVKKNEGIQKIKHKRHKHDV